MVCNMPVDAQHNLADIAPARGEDSERHRHQDRPAERDRDQGQMVDRVAPEARPDRVGPRGGLDAEALGNEGGGDLHVGHALDLHLLVHRAHLVRVDGAPEPGERRDGLGRAPDQILPVQQHRVVDREVVLVVLEDRQVVVRNLGVGRVDVGRVHVARGEPAIGEIVVEPGHVRLRQIVERLEAGPAVGAVEELVVESEAADPDARADRRSSRCRAPWPARASCRRHRCC